MTETNPEPQTATAPASETAPESATTGPQEARKPFEPIFEDRSFVELLKSYVGKTFLIANPESFEESGFGHQITAGWYKARLLGLGQDYLIVLTEFTHGAGKKATKEPLKQFIPIERIKRISIMRSERLIHI